jgi:hypothetical protein
MSGSAGPSGLDTFSWKRFILSFGQASNDLSKAVACMCRRICTEYVDPIAIEALTSCRLIALDKCPGVGQLGLVDVFEDLLYEL